MAEKPEEGRGLASRLLFGFSTVAIAGFLGLQVGNKPAVVVDTAKPADALAGESALPSPPVSPCKALPPSLKTVAAAQGGCPNSETDWTNLFGKQGPRILVATVPDPDTLSFGNYTTQAIESILRAASTASYSFDRHWLPWNAASAKAARLNFAPRQEEPGVMVFRREGEPGLVVFLVGETPTAGIHQPVFASAIRYAQALHPGEKELRVLGPTYSGSASSLRRALDQGGVSARIVTGSATSTSVKTRLAGGRHKFEAVIENDDEALRRFLAFTFRRQRSCRPLSTAYLLETGTEYATPKQAAGTMNCVPAEQPTNYYFPMQIARMRAAYQNDPVLREQGRQPGQNRTGLDLRFSETEGGYDKFPDYSPDSTALGQERTLERITNVLRDQRPSFVSVFASDIRDTLFLSAYLRRSLPSFPLVLVDSDVLYGSESGRFALDGALSLATYPLLLETQEWREGLGGRRQFPSLVAQGIYNATLLQLDAKDRLLGLEAVPGDKSAHPVIWLTMVAKGTNWPVAVLPAGADAGNAWLPLAEKIAPAFGPLDTGFIFFVLALTLTPLLVMMLTVGGWRAKVTAPPDLVAWLHEFDYLKLMGEPVAVGVTLVSVTALQALLAGVLGPYAVESRESQGYSWLAWAAAALAIFCGGLAIRLWVRCVGQLWRHASPPIRLSLVALTLGGGAAAGILGGLRFWYFEPENWTGFFFIYRSIHIDSGASPLLPMALLLLVIALTSWSHLRANTIWHHHAPRFPKAGPKWKDAVALLSDTVGGGVWPMWGGLVWIILSAIGIQLWRLQTIECRAYNITFAVIMGAAYWSLSYLFLRFLRTGHQLRRIASELEEAGFSASIEHLRKLRSWGLWEGHSWRAMRSARARQIELLELDPNLAESELRAQVDAKVDSGEPLAIQFGLAIQLGLRILRRQLFFLGAGIVCTLVAFQSYPFEPRQWIAGYVALTSLGMSLAVFTLLVTIEHDPLLTRLFGNEQKGMDIGFYFRTAAALLIPVLTVVSSLFPDFGQEISRWILPWLQASR